MKVNPSDPIGCVYAIDLQFSQFSTVTSTIFGAALLFASKAVADVDFFDYPAPNTVFQVGKSIQFVVDDAPDGDDGDDRVYADLYTANGR